MKTKLFHTTTMLVAGLMLATTSVLIAQPGPPEPPDRPVPPDRQGPPRNFPPGGPERMQRMAPAQWGAPGLMRLVGILTPEQRASVRELMQENREKSKETEEKLLKARKELIEAGLQDDFNEKAVRKQARIVAEIEADRMVEMAKVLSKVQPPLSEEQKRQLREPPPFREGDGRAQFRDRRFGPERGRPTPPPGEREDDDK